MSLRGVHWIRKYKWGLLTLSLMVCLLITSCGPNGIIGFQGRLTDSSGVPLNGSVDVTFKIYTAASGGSPVYTDAHTGVTVTDGLLNVGIGSGTGGELDPKDFARPLWLEIVVNGETLSPRQQMLGAPYAMSLMGGAVVGSTAIDNSDPDYGALNVVNGSSGTALVVSVLDGEGGADLIRGCDTNDGTTCDDVEFVVSGDGEVFADQGYNCGVNISDGLDDAFSELEIEPCLKDLSPAADFAEVLPAADGLEAGDVLIIGADGKLAKSTAPYQTQVAGVYSARPSYIGNASMLGQDGYVPLAVVGITPIKATAENGPIQPGDMLTTSSTPGFAMKAGANPPSGTVIGKALSPLEGEVGIVRALVMLQ